MTKESKQRLIYARYILPPVLILMILLFAFIPSYRYVADGEAREPISLATLISNSWESSRETLFAKNDATRGELLFSKTMMALICGFAALYAAALAISVWSAYVALKYFISDDEQSAERTRTLFITFFPNRIVLTVAEAFIVFLTAIPYLMPMIYAYTLGARVRFTLCAPDGLIFAFITIVVISLLSLICAPYERRLKADVFAHRPAFADSEIEVKDEVKDEDDESYRALRDDQAERIRRLLGKDNQEDK